MVTRVVDVSVESAFSRGRQGNVLHTRFMPKGEPRCALIFVHGFAEELAKSRHVVSAAARQLAANGVAVCALDLYGCGDSAGSLAQASFQSWCADVHDAACVMSERWQVDCHLWAMRSGALIAMESLRQWGARERHLLLWQPVTRGRMAINEFLRLRTAASMMGGDARETVDSLREIVSKDGVLEVAGYPLGRTLVQELDPVELVGEIPPGTHIAWFDVSTSPQRELSPAMRRTGESLRSSGAQVTLERVCGPAFWASGELQFCPPLIERTTAYAQQVLLT